MNSLGDEAMTVRKAAEELKKLKLAYEASEMPKCDVLLKSLKRLLIKFPTYLYPSWSSPTRGEELMLAREVLEIGALVSAKNKALDEFEQYFNQLQVYYIDVPAADLPESPRYMVLLGLNLVRLLVMSHIAQFHTELERIGRGGEKNQYIRFAVLLERCLMEGSYKKLLNCRKQAPSNEYIPVVEMLEETVRTEVALCIPQSYKVLSIAAAQKIMMLPSIEQVMEVGQQQGWELSEDGKSFIFMREEDVSRKKIQFEEMLSYSIDYAVDLQKIV